MTEFIDMSGSQRRRSSRLSLSPEAPEKSDKKLKNVGGSERVLSARFTSPTLENDNTLFNSVKRRSPRLTSPQLCEAKETQNDNKMALASAAVKRRITVKKIAPRKTVAPSENNKENTPRRSGAEGGSQENKKPKISTPGPGRVQGRGRSSSAGKEKSTLPSPVQNNKENTLRRSGRSKAEDRAEGDPQQNKKQKLSTPGSVPGRSSSSSSFSSVKEKPKSSSMPSPILPCSPPCAEDPEDAVWSQKVRRSYSRLSDKSFNNSAGEASDALFGFDTLKTPEVFQRVRKTLEVSASLSALNSFTSLLEAEQDCGSAAVVPELDLNIPGVAVVKEKRTRRKKVPQIDTKELDTLAAQMNAEFDEAEDFELFVE